MNRFLGYYLIGAALAAGLLFYASARAADCPAGVDPTASAVLAVSSTATVKTDGCKVRTSHGYSIPDPACTPGAVNPTVTAAVLRAGTFRTPCERNTASSAAAKAKTYAEYGIAHPAHNTGAGQTCELDHLVSLEIGGADTVDNIWPQCGPDGVALNARYFKVKDKVENYLAAQVRAGKMTPEAAQHGIATDWTQYIEAAK